MKFVALFMTCTFVIAGWCAEEKKDEPIDAPTIQRQGDELTASVIKKVNALLPHSPHQLFTAHLKSLRTMVQVEWATITLNLEKDLRAGIVFVKNTKIIDDGLNGDAAKWETYAQGRRPLIRGFMAHHDRVFSFYQLRLPANWDPSKEYPTVFYLHGYTPNPYMTWLAHYGFRGAEAPASSNQYFNIGIWGRGNTSYRYAGEVDLDNAVYDFQQNFKHDKDRVYLTGHSMGSFGSWAYAIDRPDIWAAMSIWSGADGLAPLGTGLAQNIAHIPVRIWHGAKDMSVTVEMADRFATALQNFGNKPTLVIDPNGGHMVSKDARGPNKEWLFQHKRQKPNPLRFKVANARYPGAWGITLRVDPSIDSHPSYICHVDGNNVHITTKGTNGLKINLGAKTAEEIEAEKKKKYRGPQLYERQDLGLSGDVKVYWNGLLSYEGPVKELSLGEGIKKTWHKAREEKQAKLAAAEAKRIKKTYRKIEAPEKMQPQKGGNLRMRFDDAEREMLFQSLSRNSGYYLYFNKHAQLKGRITMSFNAKTWEEVLKQLAEHLNLKAKFTKDSVFFDQKVQGN